MDASVVSYGPCQTPTLNFCVERHQTITAFQPEPFWTLRPHCSKNGQRFEGHICLQSIQVQITSQPISSYKDATSLSHQNSDLSANLRTNYRQLNRPWCPCSIDVEWRRGRVFDADIACVFQRIVTDSGSLKVTAVASSEERRHRPHGTYTASKGYRISGYWQERLQVGDVARRRHRF